MELHACSNNPLSLRERAGVRAPLRNDLTPRKGCAVFQATVQIELNACTASPLSLWERVGVRALPAQQRHPFEKAAPFSRLRFYAGF